MSFLEMSVHGSGVRCEPSFTTAGIIPTSKSRPHTWQHLLTVSWQMPLSVNRISRCASRAGGFRRYGNEHRICLPPGARDYRQSLYIVWLVTRLPSVPSSYRHIGSYSFLTCCSIACVTNVALPLSCMTTSWPSSLVAMSSLIRMRRRYGSFRGISDAVRKLRSRTKIRLRSVDEAALMSAVIFESYSFWRYGDRRERSSHRRAVFIVKSNYGLV